MPRITRQQGRGAAATGPARQGGKAMSDQQARQGVDIDAEIARVAYELWERRGRQNGSDQRDWFEAERIVRGRVITRQDGGVEIGQVFRRRN